MVLALKIPLGPALAWSSIVGFDGGTMGIVDGGDGDDNKLAIGELVDCNRDPVGNALDIPVVDLVVLLPLLVLFCLVPTFSPSPTSGS